MTTLKTDTDLVPSASRDGEIVIASICGEIDLHNSPELRHALLICSSKTLRRNSC